MDRRIPRGSLVHVEYFLEFIDRHGPRRLCSVGELAPADRAALTRALATGYTPEVIAKAKQSIERLDEACRAASAGSRP